MKKTTKIYTLLVVSILLVSCSNDDSVLIETPEVNFNSTSINVTFFESGNSMAPIVNWNGDAGDFSLETSIEGLSINAVTGVLSWTKLLPPKTHNIQVIAINSAGSTIVEITLNNPLQGVFTGTYNNTTFFDMDFKANSNMILKANSETNPDTGSGTYTIIDNTIIVNYSYDSNGLEYSTKGTLTQTQTEASYIGNWYSGHDAVDANLGGSIEIEMN